MSNNQGANRLPTKPQPAVVVICRDLGGPGAVANVAIKQMKSFSGFAPVHFISESKRSDMGKGSHYHPIHCRDYSRLRRLAHVPTEFEFALQVRKKLLELHQDGLKISWVISHGHLPALKVAGVVRDTLKASLALVVHGDVFDRPIRMYGFGLSMLYRWAAPRAYRVCDRVIALSLQGKGIALNAGAPAENISVLPNGIDLDEIGLGAGISLSRDEICVDKVELLFVGRLSHEKGLDILLTGCAKARKAGAKFRLKVAGDGPDASQLKNLVSRLQLNEQVIFLGKVNREDIGKLYQSHSLVCMPSRSDPFPLVGLEAMASGTPVAAAPVGGLKDFLANGLGVLVEENSPSAWAQLIVELSKSPSRYQNHATRASEQVIQRHNWQAVSLKLLRTLFPDRCTSTVAGQ